MKALLVKIGRNIAAPIGQRMGTAVAAYLLAHDIPGEMVQQFLTALGVVGGLAFDIAVSMWVDKRRAI